MGTTFTNQEKKKQECAIVRLCLDRFPCHNKVLQTEGLNSRSHVLTVLSLEVGDQGPGLQGQKTSLGERLSFQA